MKTIAALVTLICILGLSSAQTIFTGEGYSASQLAFYNSPGESTLSPMSSSIGDLISPATRPRGVA